MARTKLAEFINSITNENDLRKFISTKSYNPLRMEKNAEPAVGIKTTDSFKRLLQQKIYLLITFFVSDTINHVIVVKCYTLRRSKILCQK